MDAEPHDHAHGLERSAAGAPLAERDEATFPPPDEPIMVYCLHCGKEYMSSEMIFRREAPGKTEEPGFWYCPTQGCTVGGFGLDVFPVDPEWKDPKGILHTVWDPEDDDDLELDDDDDDFF